MDPTGIQREYNGNTTLQLLERTSHREDYIICKNNPRDMYMDVQQLGKSLVYIFTYLQYTYCSQNNSLHKYEDNIHVILCTIYVHLFSISLVLFNLKVLFLFFILTGIPPTGSRDRIYWGDGCVCSRPTPGTWGPRPPDTHRLHDNTKSPD